MSIEQTYFLGIDGGGSKCRAILTDQDGKLLGEGLSGAANLLRGVDATKQAILQAWDAARSAASLPVDIAKQVIAGLGLAGANIPELHAEMAQWHSPFAHHFVTTDLDIACIGAHEGHGGAVVIIGTGSCGMVNKGEGLTGEESVYLGGHGFLLGDKGSGAWFGLQAITTTLEALNGLQKKTALVDVVLRATACADEIQLVTRWSGLPPKKFATLAPYVFQLAEAGDCHAQRIVAEGTEYLTRICRQLLSHHPKRLSLIGGLAPLVAQQLPKHIGEHITPPKMQPEWGAILWAKMSLQTVQQSNQYSKMALTQKA